MVCAPRDTFVSHPNEQSGRAASVTGLEAALNLQEEKTWNRTINSSAITFAPAWKCSEV
jgi:hypothetical protein